MTDTNADASGTPYLKFQDVVVGMEVHFDSGFTCTTEGTHTVQADDTGRLFVPCRNGKHFLSGQENEDGYLVGITAVPKTPTDTSNQHVVTTVAHKVYIFTVTAHDPSRAEMVDGKYAVTGELDQALAVKMFFAFCGIDPDSVDISIEAIDRVVSTTPIARFGPGMSQGAIKLQPWSANVDIEQLYPYQVPHTPKVIGQPWIIIKPGMIKLHGTKVYIQYDENNPLHPFYIVPDESKPDQFQQHVAFATLGEAKRAVGSLMNDLTAMGIPTVVC